MPGISTYEELKLSAAVVKSLLLFSGIGTYGEFRKRFGRHNHDYPNKVFPVRNNPTKLTRMFNGEMVFEIPVGVITRDELMVHEKNEKAGRKYTYFIEKK